MCHVSNIWKLTYLYAFHWNRPFTGQFLTLAFRVNITLLVYLVEGADELCCYGCPSGNSTSHPVHITLSSPRRESSCICLEIAAKGKKEKWKNIVECTNSHICALVAHVCAQLWKLGKICSKIYFYPNRVVSTPYAHPFPRAIMSVVQRVEAVGFKFGAAL